MKGRQQKRPQPTARRDNKQAGGASNSPGRKGKNRPVAAEEKCKFVECDEKLCKKLEELEIKPKVLEPDYCPRFDKYVDDIDCN